MSHYLHLHKESAERILFESFKIIRYILFLTSISVLISYEREREREREKEIKEGNENEENVRGKPTDERIYEKHS